MSNKYDLMKELGIPTTIEYVGCAFSTSDIGWFLPISGIVLGENRRVKIDEDSAAAILERTCREWLDARCISIFKQIVRPNEYIIHNGVVAIGFSDSFDDAQKVALKWCLEQGKVNEKHD